MTPVIYNGTGSSQTGKLYKRVRAVIFREIRSRYTGDKLGYLWAYIAPLAWIAIIYILFQLLGRSSPIDTDIASFIFSGIIPYLSARFIINAVMRARMAYRNLMTLPSVTALTVYLSVFILELFNSILIYAVLLCLNYIVFGFFEIDEPIVAIWGFLLACGSGGAFGFLIVNLARKSEIFAKATPIFLRPLFYLSGVFYTVNELPPSLVGWIYWNPLLHAIEILRDGLFVSYDSRMGTALIPISFIIVATLAGLYLGRTSHTNSGGDTPIEMGLV